MPGLSVSWVDKEGLSGMERGAHSFHFTWITPWDRTQSHLTTWDDIIANKSTKPRAKCRSAYVWASRTFWRKRESFSWKLKLESASIQKPCLKQPSRSYIPVPSRRKWHTIRRNLIKSLFPFFPSVSKACWIEHILLILFLPLSIGLKVLQTISISLILTLKILTNLSFFKARRNLTWGCTLGKQTRMNTNKECNRSHAKHDDKIHVPGASGSASK